MTHDLQRVLVKGGVLSPGELKHIISMVEILKLDTISFGSRQDILFPYQKGTEEILDQFCNLTVNLVGDRSYQNIVSSYVSADIFPHTIGYEFSKMFEAIYKEDSFPLGALNLKVIAGCVDSFKNELSIRGEWEVDNRLSL